ncbi:MAG: TetR/AcrR family transcriptional regulator [Woeseiaceae bacterium]|nr:TetR/AcrR family transcriptional regulator [Woeseiaceae bacterium]
MARPNTRTRILVTSLVMFNEHGEANTTTNDIADETDISPGNLHYHFRKKSDLVDALIAEFQADVREVLQPPGQDESAQDSAIDEFWGFVQLLIEVLAAYRFLIRDTETMVERYPQVAKAIRGFATALLATIELHIDNLSNQGIIDIPDSDIEELSRSIATAALFSQRFDSILGEEVSIEDAAARLNGAAISLLLPYAKAEAAEPLYALLAHYRQ